MSAGRGKLDHCGPRQSVGRLIFGCPSSSLPVVFVITIAPLGGVAIGYILVSISSFWVMTVIKKLVGHSGGLKGAGFERGQLIRSDFVHTKFVRARKNVCTGKNVCTVDFNCANFFSCTQVVYKHFFLHIGCVQTFFLYRV